MTKDVRGVMVAIAWVVLAAALAGCATSARPARVAEPASPAATNSAPVVASDLPPTRPEVARIRPGLVISFSLLVGGKVEFGEVTKRISDAGTLVLPLLGTVSAQDVTLEELGNQLVDRYSKYYVNPQVIVDFVRDSTGEGLSPWGHVTVLGRVKTPGRVSIPATRDLTVSGAIQKAGGFHTSARSEAILVTRRNAQGETTSREINLHEVGAGGRVSDDLVLQADDIVYVPEARF
jgi:polysaccharide export outer membrane protein